MPTEAELEKLFVRVAELEAWREQQQKRYVEGVGTGQKETASAPFLGQEPPKEPEPQEGNKSKEAFAKTQDPPKAKK